MEHAQDLTALAAVLSAAVICGLVINRLRQPAAVGFILAGVVLGPTGAGLVTSTESVRLLADLGVLMLLFIIGMEMRLQSFRQLLPLALGVAAVQIAACVALALVFANVLGVGAPQAMVIGFMLAISSTAIALKMMEDAKETAAPAGRIALAVLIAQDLAVVPLLVIVHSLGSAEPAIAPVMMRVGLAVALLAGFMVLLTRIKSFRFPFSEFFLRDADIGTLGVLGLCFTAAALSGLLGLSPALGAFLVGLAVGHSTLRRAAVRTAQPVQSILLFTFFLSVGLLIDLNFIWSELLFILLLLVLVAVGRTALNVLTLMAFGQPGSVAFPAALFLAPIGEFSFVLAAAGLSAGVLTGEGHKLAIAVIALSLLSSPLWFVSARRAHALAMRGITGLAAMLRGTYRREFFVLRVWRQRVFAWAGAALSDLMRRFKTRSDRNARQPNRPPRD